MVPSICETKIFTRCPLKCLGSVNISKSYKKFAKVFGQNGNQSCLFRAGTKNKIKVSK